MDTRICTTIAILLKIVNSEMSTISTSSTMEKIISYNGILYSHGNKLTISIYINNESQRHNTEQNKRKFIQRVFMM
jgi:hypothetical protein